jgi:hypothetical protein
MRKGIYSIFAAVVLICLFAVSSAKAQSTNRVLLQADIPFEFTVGNVTLPAGKYTVSSASDSFHILRLRSADGQAGALVHMNSINGKADESAKLVFSRYGNHYFFAQAWMPATITGLEAPKSGAQRAIERELATTGLKTEKVALTVRR